MLRTSWNLEVAQVLRRLVREGTVPANRADEAVRDLLDLRLTRYPHSHAVAQGLATPPKFFCL